MTGINRATVRECINRYQSTQGLETAIQILKHRDGPHELRLLKSELISESPEVFQAYYYLLGLYLGDGCITKDPRAYRLRITLGTAYPNLIQSCVDAIHTLVPSNKINTVKKLGNCLEVYCYNTFWPDFLPPHGPGPKHERPIILEDWQRQVIEAYPLLMFKGLYHSDGCRAQNMVNRKNYPRYEFTNMSADIKRIFSDTCDLLGLHWRPASHGRNIHVARRPDVEFLDRHIGPKS